MSTLSNKTAYKWTISSNLLEGINIFKQGATQKGHGQPATQRKLWLGAFKKRGTLAPAHMGWV